MESFHKMQGNYEVMKFVRGKAMTFEENKQELKKLISSYELDNSKLKVFAMENKLNKRFVGTVALIIESDENCEIGYRVLQEYWGNGFGSEMLNGLVRYCKEIGILKLLAYVAVANPASEKILIKEHFAFQEDVVFPDLNIPERKYLLRL